MLGLIGKKEGMTQIFDEAGDVVPVTVVSVPLNVVLGLKTNEKDGYSAAVIGSGERKEKTVSKAEFALSQKAGLEKPVRAIWEMREFGKEVKVGDKLGVELLESFLFIDAVATSKGKGFQGVMKRHNFHGGPAGHGSKFHREAGGTGMATWPGRTHKGTKTAGRMGGARVTVQNLELVRVDKENQILLIKGAVPGRRGATVLIRSAKKA